MKNQFLLILEKEDGPMIRIAIVEDEEQASRTLTSVLKLYAKKENLVFSIALYKNAESFLVETSKAFDIVFFDIELPGISGMDAAFKLRESDSSIIIIFVTNMAQYAVRGYEVDALYYIIKPFTYQKVEYKLKKAMAILKAETNTNII